MAEFHVRPIEDRDVAAVVDLWKSCGLVVAQNDPFKDIALARGKDTSDVLVGIVDQAVTAAIWSVTTDIAARSTM